MSAQVRLSIADHQVVDVLCCLHSLLLPILLLLLLPQKLLRSAYQGALSYPLIPELEDLHHINSHVLSDFVAQHYTGMKSICIQLGFVSYTLRVVHVDLAFVGKLYSC
jgi:hypothetical protein